MAIVASTSEVLNKIIVTTWSNLANGDTGQPFNHAQYSDKTVQIKGTFGSGGSITMQGSNERIAETAPASATWVTLTDPQGNAITKTAAAGEAILENFLFIRPSVTAGDGTTSLTVIICAKGEP